MLIDHVAMPEYGLPVDDEELDRLDMNHQKYTMLIGDNLFLAPIDPNPQKILDLGTGTGVIRQVKQRVGRY
jgi:ubiquinone/menaquinone biosynthesis C-methylase UbiE